MSTVNVPGVNFAFSGGKTLVIPPLSLGDLEQLQDRIAEVKGGVDKESVKTIVDVTHAALKRNYPEMERSEVAALLDLGNMLDVFQCVMDVSGTRRKAQEKESGEVQAPLSGAASTRD